MGWIVATTDETDVITYFATQYVQTRGGDAQMTDCVAYPGHDIPGIWIKVSCRPSGALESYEYYVNRFGGLERGDWPVVRQNTPLEPQA